MDMVRTSAPGEENLEENPTNHGNLTPVLGLSWFFRNPSQHFLYDSRGHQAAAGMDQIWDARDEGVTKYLQLSLSESFGETQNLVRVSWLWSNDGSKTAGQKTGEGDRERSKGMRIWRTGLAPWEFLLLSPWTCASVSGRRENEQKCKGWFSHAGHCMALRTKGKSRLELWWQRVAQGGRAPLQ